MRKFRSILLLMAALGAVAAAAAAGAPAAPAVPQAKTGSATNVTESGTGLAATLNGTVNPDGLTTTYHFDYGTTTAYGSSTAPTSVPAGTADVPAIASLAKLSASSTYHFRLVAVNANGTTTGTDELFKPLSTGNASRVSQTSATLNGTLNPLGQGTQYHFEFGTTPSYGQQTPSQTVNDTGNLSVHAFVGDLHSSTVYHYRLVATSGGSTYYGADRSLTTTGSQIHVMGRMGFVSPGRWIGVEIGCFSGNTPCAGHITMSHNGTVVGQRNFSIPAQSGGFQNIQLTPAGARLLSFNRPHHLLPVSVKVDTSNGQHLSYTMRLARWVWR